MPSINETLPSPSLERSELVLKRGVCYVLFAFELGMSVDLDRAAQLIKHSVERTKFRRDRRAPKYFDYDPAPVRVAQPGQQMNVGKFFTKAQAELTLFDFGACSVSYEIEISGPLGNLIELAEVLYDNPFLLADARTRVSFFLDEIRAAVARPRLNETVEDFTLYHLEEVEGADSAAAAGGHLINEFPAYFARMLRAENGSLGSEEIKEALAMRTSYGERDCALIDWNAGLFFGSGVEDVLAVLEFCNVELLEMRFLDEQLDDYLEQAYNVLTTKKKGGADLNKIARLQVDSAVLYEAVENALKLLGDQYLARVYSLASSKFHLPEWNSSILRKLNTLDSIYQKLSDRAAQRRSEVLEWIVIALILFEVVIGIWDKI